MARTSPQKGAWILVSQAASSVLNLMPSAMAIATLSDRDIAAMVVALTGYLVIFSVGRSMFGEALLVLSHDNTQTWLTSTAKTLRTGLVGAAAVSGAVGSVAAAASSANSVLAISLLTVSVSFAVVSHDVRRYALIASSNDRTAVKLDAVLVFATGASLMAVWALLDESVTAYLTAWAVVAVAMSLDVVLRRDEGQQLRQASRRNVRTVATTGIGFGYDPLANRIGLFIAALIANEVAGASSLAAAETLRLSMAVVNIVFLGAGPIVLRSGPSGTIRRDSLVTSAALASVAALWWTAITAAAAIAGSSLPDTLAPWEDGPRWIVLIWFLAASVPFGFRYRLRIARAGRRIVMGASTEAVAGLVAITLAVSVWSMSDATAIFATYFVAGAVVWIVVGSAKQRSAGSHEARASLD